MFEYTRHVCGPSGRCLSEHEHVLVFAGLSTVESA